MRKFAILLILALLGALTIPALATLQQPPDWSVTGQSANERMGSLAFTGDFDADGAADLVVTARLPGGPSNAFLWYGSQGAFMSSGYYSWDWEWTSPHTPDEVVSGAAGDFGGDGYLDLALGASISSEPPSVLVWYSTGSGGIDGSEDWSAWSSGDLNSQFGRNMTAGDFNGDGYADLAVSESARVSDSNCASGYHWNTVLHVYSGSASGLTADSHTGNGIPDWNFSLSDTDCVDTDAFLAAGDIDGDGYDDLVAVSNHTTSATGVQVFFGRATGLPSTVDWSIAEGGEFSAALGDVDGDGYADLFISGPNDGVFGWYGGPLGLPSGASYGSADWSYYDATHGLPSGPSSEIASHMTIGDINGDGYGDLVIGEPYYDGSSLTDNGAVFVFYGSSTGLIASTHTDPATPADADEALYGTEDGEQFGYTVTAGNFDAQYGLDVVAGAPFYGANDEGRALGYYAGVPPTATPTNTPAPPTATPTNTPVPPTATPTDTPVPPTATPAPSGPSTIYLPLVMKGVQSPQPQTESEPNDTFETANPVSLPAAVDGHHDGQAGTGDVFALSLLAGDKVRLTLDTADEHGVQVVVYDVNLNELTRDFTAPFDVSFVAVGDGVYFVYVYTPAEADNTAAYTLTLQSESGLLRSVRP